MLVETQTVSCLIACWNASNTILEAIASATSQSGVVVDVIVVDDGSTDNSADLVAGVAAADRRIKLVRLPRSSGPATARNLAIDQATGDWVAVLDADDAFEPGRLSALVAACEAEACDVGFDNQRVVERHAGPGANGTGYPAFVGFPRRIDIAAFYRLSHFKKGSLSIGFAKPLVRRSALRAHGIRYQPTMRVSEDWRFLHDLVTARGNAVFVDRQTYRYYRSSASITRGSPGNAWWPVLRAYASALMPGAPAPKQIGLHRLLVATFSQALLKEGRTARGRCKSILLSLLPRKMPKA